VRDLPIGKRPINEAQARWLVRLTPEERLELAGKVDDFSKITAAQVRKITLALVRRRTAKHKREAAPREEKRPPSPLKLIAQKIAEDAKREAQIQATAVSFRDTLPREPMTIPEVRELRAPDNWEAPAEAFAWLLHHNVSEISNDLARNVAKAISMIVKESPVAWAVLREGHRRHTQQQLGIFLDAQTEKLFHFPEAKKSGVRHIEPEELAARWRPKPKKNKRRRPVVENRPPRIAKR
jgi:hypothetical protein